MGGKGEFSIVKSLMDVKCPSSIQLDVHCQPLSYESHYSSINMAKETGVLVGEAPPTKEEEYPGISNTSSAERGLIRECSKMVPFDFLQHDYSRPVQLLSPGYLGCYEFAWSWR